MKTAEEILKEKIHPTWFSFNDGDRSIVEATKSAMQEYADQQTKELTELVRQIGGFLEKLDASDGNDLHTYRDELEQALTPYNEWEKRQPKK